MTLLCVVYVMLITGALSCAGVAAEHALADRFPRRWLWCGLVALSLLIPPIARATHAMPIDVVLAGVPGNAAASAMWWGRSVSYDGTLMQSWLVVSGMLLLWGGVSTWRTRRLIAQGNSQVVGGVPVVMTNGIGPATVGYWNAEIVVPRWVLGLPPRHRMYVLRHEVEHREARDGFLLLVASLAVVLTPWNLPLYWVIRRLRLAVEIDCDARVIRALGNAPDYAELLVDIARVNVSSLPASPALIVGTGSLEKRLRSLVAHERHPVVALFLAPVMTCALVAAVVLMPHPVLKAAHHPAGVTTASR